MKRVRTANFACSEDLARYKKYFIEEVVKIMVISDIDARRIVNRSYLPRCLSKFPVEQLHVDIHNTAEDICEMYRNGAFQ